jgi:hypothetical protein
MDRDANRVPITGQYSFREKIVLDFSGAGGAQGQTPIFDIEGFNLVTLFWRVTESLDSAGAATLSLDIPAEAGYILEPLAYTDLTAGVFGVGGELATEYYGIGETGDALALSTDITISAGVADADLTAGKIEFYALWRPLSDDASVSPA